MDETTASERSRQDAIKTEGGEGVNEQERGQTVAKGECGHQDGRIAAGVDGQGGGERLRCVRLNGTTVEGGEAFPRSIGSSSS